LAASVIRRVFLLVFVNFREVAGFLFSLLLFCSHPIQLRFIKHDLDCVVPAEIVMFIKDCANLFL